MFIKKRKHFKKWRVLSGVEIGPLCSNACVNFWRNKNWRKNEEKSTYCLHKVDFSFYYDGKGQKQKCSEMMFSIKKGAGEILWGDNEQAIWKKMKTSPKTIIGNFKLLIFMFGFENVSHLKKSSINCWLQLRWKKPKA